MKAKIKAKYDSPTMEVVQLQVKASLCFQSGDRTIDFKFEDNGDFYPIPQDPGIGWGRGGYGNADEI